MLEGGSTKRGELEGVTIGLATYIDAGLFQDREGERREREREREERNGATERAPRVYYATVEREERNGIPVLPTHSPSLCLRPPLRPAHLCRPHTA